MDIVDRLRHFVITEMKWKGTAEQLTEDFSLIENHVIDSLGLFMLVAFLSKEFGVTIGFEELNPQDFETIGGIARLVERKRGAATQNIPGA